jgi:hypothetical protein
MRREQGGGVETVFITDAEFRDKYRESEALL